MKKTLPSLIFLWLILNLSGCQTPQTLEPKALPRDLADNIAEARALYNDGNLTQALIACVNIQHRHPNTPALIQLQSEIMTTLNERRIVEQQLRREDSMTRGMLESAEDATLPDTYGLRRYIQGNDSSHIQTS